MPPDHLPLAGSLAEPEAITDFLLYRLHRVLATGGALVTRMCEVDFGVTRREWRVLATLAVHGPLSSAGLAELTRLDRPTTSKAVTSLVMKSLVKRTSRRGDARFSHLALTESGIELYQRMFPSVRAVSSELLSPLRPEEVALLDTMLVRVQEHAEQVAHLSVAAHSSHRRGGRATGTHANTQAGRV